MNTMLRGRRGAADVVKALEARLGNGQAKAGEFLPSVRAISGEFGCAPLTAHRAMRQLVRRGLVTAEPRQGYRVAVSGAKLPRTATVAFLEETENYAEYLGAIYQTQIRALQRQAMSRNWTFVLLPYRQQSVGSIRERLTAIGATALILQDVPGNFPKDLLVGLGRLGLPVVRLDEPYAADGIDHVLRDEIHGAALAMDYLVGKGHREIGWYGRLRGTGSGRSRFAGAAQVLLREELPIDGQGWRDIENALDPAVAREFLLRKNRPAAVLALSQTAALALAQAALDLGLKLGRDLDIVGWCLAEHFEKEYAAVCPELAAACATVTWSMADVGRTVFNRIEERRREPDLPNASILLPMTLREPATRTNRETRSRK